MRGSGLEDLMVGYFKDIFTSRMGNMEPTLEHVTACVTEEMNQKLVESYSMEEVKAALFSMKPDKAPGIDGFNPVFFQSHWEIVGPEVSRVCIQYLQEGSFPTSWNETVLVLIPKKQTPQVMSDLRPIALCNVIYKIMSKMIANRLIVMLDTIVSPTQNAFIPGRSIQDNNIIAFEIMNYFNNKRRCKDYFAALKMDISKAYDRMEW